MIDQKRLLIDTPSPERPSHSVPSGPEISSRLETRPPSDSQPRIVSSVLFVCASLIPLLIWLNGSCAKPLYKLGLEFILWYQELNHSSVIYFIWNIFSHFGNTTVVGILLGILFVTQTKRLSFYVFLVYFIASLYVVNILKQNYQQYRPFWSSSKVHLRDWHCQKDFGSPSGHNFATIILHEYLLTLILPVYFPSCGNILKSVILGVITVGTFFSRMVLGSHSLNQVAFGLILGLTSLCLYRYHLYELIYRLCWRLFALKESKLLFLIIMCHVAALCVPVIAYSLNVDSQLFSYSILQNASEACSKDLTFNYLIQKAFVNTFVVNVVFGMLYGLFGFAFNVQNKQFLLGNFRIKCSRYCVLTALGLVAILGVGGLLIARLLLELIDSNPILSYTCISLGMTLGVQLVISTVTQLFISQKWIDIENKQE